MLTVDAEIERRVAAALAASRFAEAGGLVCDLDGTAVHQQGDLVMIAEPVQQGLERVRDAGRPVIINTLRFPLSIMRTFGLQWAVWTRRPLPCVTLNGSLIGDIVQSASGALVFEERAAFPLQEAEVEIVVAAIEEAMGAGSDAFTLFAYPRDWQAGEWVWTPRADRVGPLREKYVSAAQVAGWPVARLRTELQRTSLCMLAIHVEDPTDRRLAFQHGRASGFFTADGVDKRSGASHLSGLLGTDMKASIGAGDTELDTFLDGIGLAVLVGNASLPFKGVHDTLRLSDPFAFGAVLSLVARHCERVVP